MDKLCFEPVFNKNSVVLILGSFPSEKSLKQGFYYGNKNNRFWKILSQYFNEKIEDEIDNKKQFLLLQQVQQMFLFQKKFGSKVLMKYLIKKK